MATLHRPSWRSRTLVPFLVAAVAVPAGAGTAAAATPDSPLLTIDVSRPGNIVDPELFGAIISFQDLGQGALDPAKARTTTGIGAFYPGYVKMLRDLGIKQIRFGDASPTASIYEWHRSIGPQARRTEQRSRSGSPGTSPAYGPDEFAQLAEAIGAQSNWVYNIEHGNAQDAANLLAYFVAPVSAHPSRDPNSPSYWAAKRAANGHPAPYSSLDLFDIGNEDEGRGGWRSGTTVSIGAHTTADAGIPDNDLLYAFGGVTAFTGQPLVGYADLTSSSAISTGTRGQDFYINYAPVVPGSQTVFVDGVPWTQVGNLKTAGSQDHVYALDNTTGQVSFGDGRHGALPPAGSQITASYQSGPHDGFVQYYAALKKVAPRVQVIAQDSNVGFLQAMGDTYPYDGVARHPLGTGFPSTSLPVDEFQKQELLAPGIQADQMTQMQQTIDQNAGKHVPLLLTAYGHSQGNLPAGDTVYHLRLIDGILQANQLMQYQNAGFTVAHRFLLNDKPFNPNPNEAPPARRFNAMIISDGVHPDFVTAPTGLAFSLVANLAGKRQLAATISGNPAIPLATGDSIPTLTTMAARSSDGGIDIIVVNQSLDANQRVTLQTRGGIHGPVATVTTMNGATSLSLNTLDDSTAVRNTTVKLPVGLGTFSYEFPAHSVSLVHLPSLFPGAW